MHTDSGMTGISLSGYMPYMTVASLEMSDEPFFEQVCQLCTALSVTPVSLCSTGLDILFHTASSLRLRIEPTFTSGLYHNPPFLGIPGLGFPGRLLSAFSCNCYCLTTYCIVPVSSSRIGYAQPGESVVPGLHGEKSV